MDVSLWIAQVLLAAVFVWSGVVKGTWSKERLIASGQTGVVVLAEPLLRFTAASELAGAIGLIIPEATGIAPTLTPLAAIGLGVIMILAAGVHAKLREPRNVASNMVLLALCLFVAVGRLA